MMHAAGASKVSAAFFLGLCRHSLTNVKAISYTGSMQAGIWRSNFEKQEKE